MTFLLDYVLKASVLLSIALIGCWLLRGRSAALRHWILTVGLFASAILPLVSRIGPEMQMNLPATVVSPLMPASLPAPEPSTQIDTPGAVMPIALARPAPEPGRWIVRAWYSGMALGLIGFLIGALRLHRIAAPTTPLQDGVWVRQADTISRKYGLTRYVRLLQTRHPSMLVTWGIRRPAILLPAGAQDWNEDRIRSVLYHELAHVRRQDWCVQIVAELQRIVLWFNPLAWIVCRQVRMECEYACDDAVLDQGVAPTAYATHLLHIVQALNRPHRVWSSALTMAGSSNLERRFSAVLNTSTDRRMVTLKTSTLIALAAVLVLVPLAGLRSAPLTALPELLPIESLAAPLIEPTPLANVVEVANTPTVEEPRESTAPIPPVQNPTVPEPVLNRVAGPFIVTSSLDKLPLFEPPDIMPIKGTIEATSQSLLILPFAPWSGEYDTRISVTNPAAGKFAPTAGTILVSLYPKSDSLYKAGSPVFVSSGPGRVFGTGLTPNGMISPGSTWTGTVSELLTAGGAPAEFKGSIVIQTTFPNAVAQAWYLRAGDAPVQTIVENFSCTLEIPVSCTRGR